MAARSWDYLSDISVATVGTGGRFGVGSVGIGLVGGWTVGGITKQGVVRQRGRDGLEVHLDDGRFFGHFERRFY